MKKTIISLMLSIMAIFPTTNYASNTSDNSANTLTGYKITNIKSAICSISNSTPIDIAFTQSSTQAVKLVCPKEYKQYIIFTFKNGSLAIKLSDKLSRDQRNEISQNLRTSKIFIHADAINRISVNGSSKFQTTNDIKVTELTANLNGSGDIFFNNVEVDRNGTPGNITVTLNGSGDISFSKNITAHEVNMTVNGSGDIACRDINAENIIYSLNGSGDIDINQATATNATYNLNGSGDLEADNQRVNNIQSQLNGSGDITIEGNCNIASLQVTSPGDIQAKNLEAMTVSATVIGSGDITCHAQKNLTAKITGSGSVRYKGDPKVTKVGTKNSDNIKRL